VRRVARRWTQPNDGAFGTTTIWLHDRTLAEDRRALFRFAHDHAAVARALRAGSHLPRLSLHAENAIGRVTNGSIGQQCRWLSRAVVVARWAAVALFDDGIRTLGHAAHDQRAHFLAIVAKAPPTTIEPRFAVRVSDAIGRAGATFHRLIDRTQAVVDVHVRDKWKSWIRVIGIGKIQWSFRRSLCSRGSPTARLHRRRRRRRWFEVNDRWFGFINDFRFFALANDASFVVDLVSQHADVVTFRRRAFIAPAFLATGLPILPEPIRTILLAVDKRWTSRSRRRWIRACAFLHSTIVRDESVRAVQQTLRVIFRIMMIVRERGRPRDRATTLWRTSRAAIARYVNRMIACHVTRRGLTHLLAPLARALHASILVPILAISVKKPVGRHASFFLLLLNNFLFSRLSDDAI